MQRQDAPPVVGAIPEGDCILDVPTLHQSLTPQTEERASIKSHDKFEIPDAPFSAFTRGEKWILVIMSSVAGFFRCSVSRIQLHPDVLV